MTRLLRNTGSPAFFRRYRCKLVKHFRRRGYPRPILKQIHDITHSKRLDVLYRMKKRIPMERPLPFITQFVQYKPSLNRIFRTRWQYTYNDPTLYTLLPNAPFTVFRSKRAVGSLLSAKRRRFETERYVPNLNLGSTETFKFTRFNHHRTRGPIKGLF